jgi:TrwC relaxase
VIKVFQRRTNDVTYFTNDLALELQGLRQGPAEWWLRSPTNQTGPEAVRRVLRTTPRSLVYGYDIVVAAPRTVSVLLALDEDQAPRLIEAHRTSVKAAFQYLEERALVSRDRRNGEDLEISAKWESVVSFTHGINRHREPHLHDHMIVGAHPQSAQGVLDARALVAHLEAADAVYRASLRYEVAQRTSWQPWRSFEGIEHVSGLDEGYRTLWGGHFSERGEKSHPSRSEVTAQWLHDLERFQPEGVVGSPAVSDSLNEHTFQSAFEGELSLRRRDIVTAWANAAVWGQKYSDLRASIEFFYGVGDERGLLEEKRSLTEVRMVSEVNKRGPRSLRPDLQYQWQTRDYGLNQEFSRSDRNLLSR